MKKSIPSSTQSHLFTRDDIARFCAGVINEVLEKFGIEHTVEGIMVLPLGEDVYLVDIVMRDRTAKADENATWALSITLPPPQEVTNERE